MTPSRAHALAIYGRLGVTVGAAPASTPVHYGEVTTPDALLVWPYLVVWPPPASRAVDSLDGRSGDSLSTVTQLTGAGTTVDEVLDVLDRAATALDGWTPTISGRSCDPVRQNPDDQPPPPQQDPQVRTPDGRPVFFSLINVRLFSVAG